MPLGTVQTVLICQTSATPSAPCPAGQAPVPVQAYVLAESSGQYVDGIVEPIDYNQAAAVWGFFFATTLLLYVAAWAMGMVASPFFERFRR